MVKFDEQGLSPPLGLSVSMLESLCEQWGVPIVWEDGMTEAEKATVAGLIWLQVAEGVGALDDD